jgi:hypothetical protein
LITMPHPPVNRLGRIADTDPRDHAFLLSPRRSSLARKLWGTGNADKFDQGETSQCVSYAANRYLVAQPIGNRMPGPFADFYAECQAIDNIPMPHDGTSVRAAMKVLRAKGLVSGFRWAFAVEPIANQILTEGPVVVGTDWLEPMFSPVKGFVGLGDTYEPVGGHAYLLSGVDRAKRCPDGTAGAFRITNSWGRSWGVNGTAWISFRDFGVLLNNRGEAAVATEVLK